MYASAAVVFQTASLNLFRFSARLVDHDYIRQSAGVREIIKKDLQSSKGASTDVGDLKIKK